MSQLHLIVPLQLLLCVTSLQIELNFNISDMSFHNLIFLISLSSSLIRFHCRNILPSLLGFHLFIFSLLGSHLRVFALNDHGLGQGHLQCQFEIRRQQKSVHLQATRNFHVVDDNREV